MVVAISGINIGLTIFGAVDPKFGNKLFPSGDNIDFGYWRSWKDDSLTSKSGIFNQIYLPFDGTGVKRNNKPEVFDRVNSTNIIASGGHWAKAGFDGIPKGAMGTKDLNFVPRSIYLNEFDYINAGSGNALGYTNKFSIYAKLMPSGEQLHTRIISKHNINPAQMVLGTDPQGLYYIRADGEDDDGGNVAYYAKSDKEYSLYEFPTQVIGVFGYTSAGTGAETKNSLALYVNGKLQRDVSSRFNRSSPEDRRADNVMLTMRYLRLLFEGYMTTPLLCLNLLMRTWELVEHITLALVKLLMPWTQTILSLWLILELLRASLEERLISLYGETIFILFLLVFTLGWTILGVMPIR